MGGRVERRRSDHSSSGIKWFKKLLSVDSDKLPLARLEYDLRRDDPVLVEVHRVWSTRPDGKTVTFMNDESVHADLKK